MVTLNIQLFGGRGARSGTSKKIKSYKNVIIEDNKIYNYYLNPDKAHFKEFKDVGYSKDNAKQLRKDLQNGLLKNSVTEYTRESGYIKKVVDMELGITSKKTFRTVWGKRIDESKFRNITAYRIGGKKK